MDKPLDRKTLPPNNFPKHVSLPVIDEERRLELGGAEASTEAFKISVMSPNAEKARGVAYVGYFMTANSDDAKYFCDFRGLHKTFQVKIQGEIDDATAQAGDAIDDAKEKAKKQFDDD